jgi:hypothetical protein
MHGAKYRQKNEHFKSIEDVREAGAALLDDTPSSESQWDEVTHHCAVATKRAIRSRL